MRFLNWLLHLAVVALLFCAMAHSQTQGLLPTLIDSANPASCGVNCFGYPESVSVGNLIVVGMDQEDPGATGCGSVPNWTVTDNLGNTYTIDSSGVTPAGATNNYLELAHTVVTSSGTPQITVGFGGNCNGRVYVERFTNVSGTVDGSVATGSNGGAGVLTATTSNTTTVNGDLLVSYGVINSGPQGESSVGPTMNFGVHDFTVNPEMSPSMGYANAGLAGSQSQSMYRFGGNAGQSILVHTIAFKPSAMAIVDTALPHGGFFNTYKATIHSIGGAGAITCSITGGSLQTGLSLSGTGNCDITGTPTSASTNSITFHVTDGTNTANATLDLTVDSTFSIPSIVNTLLTNFDNGGGSKNITVNCGDVVVVLVVNGIDTHGSAGAIQAVSGVSNKVFDSFSSPIRRAFGIGGIYGGTFAYIIGPVTQSGTDTITIQNSLSWSSALGAYILDARGVQGVADEGIWANQTATGSPYTLTVPFTAPVANELVLSATADKANTSTISLAAPFSVLSTGSNGFNVQAFGLASGVTGSINHVATITDGNPDQQTTALIGLRPGALPVACPVPIAGGEKIRRRVW